MVNFLNNIIAQAKQAIGKNVAPAAALDIKGGVSINNLDTAAPDPGAGNLSVSGAIDCQSLLLNGVAIGGNGGSAELWDLVYHNDFVNPVGGNGLTRFDAYLSSNASNGSIAHVAPSNTQYHGIGALSTGTSNAGRTALVTEQAFFIQGSAAPRIYLKSVIVVPILSELSDRFGIAFGFTDSLSTIIPSNFLGIRYNDSLSSNFLVTRIIGNVVTDIDSGITVGAGSFATATAVYTLELFLNYDPGVASFSINGTTVGTLATSALTPGGFRWAPILIVKNTGSNVRTVQIDQCTLKLKRN